MLLLLPVLLALLALILPVLLALLALILPVLLALLALILCCCWWWRCLHVGPCVGSRCASVRGGGGEFHSRT
jgi:hypothetical protein